MTSIAPLLALLTIEFFRYYFKRFNFTGYSTGNHRICGRIKWFCQICKSRCMHLLMYGKRP